MQAVVEVFWNPTDRRLRAFWRVVLHFAVIFVGLQLVSAVILRPIASAVQGGDGSGPNPLLAMVSQILTGLGYVFVTILAAKLLDRRSFSDYGIVWNARWLRDLLFGLLLGALLMGVIFVFELAMGWITVGSLFLTVLPLPFAASFLLFLVLFILVGAYEELVFRGYQLKNIAEGFNFGRISGRNAVFLGWIISSILFGLLHAFNPGATAYTTFKITLGGLFLALPFMLTGKLALSIGIHVAWNFFQGNVFGFPVSGNTAMRTAIFDTVQGGPALWTGGGFGPEAGLLGFIAMIVGSLAVVWWVKRTRGALNLSLSLAEYRPPSKD